MTSHSVQDNPYNHNISMAKVYIVLLCLTNVVRHLLALHQA